MLGHVRDLASVLTGREPMGGPAHPNARWGLSIPVAAALFCAAVYALCRARWIENIFLEQACAVAVVAILGASLCTWLSIGLAHRLGAVDRPGGRHIHRGVIPRLGGVGILGGVGAAFLLKWPALADGGILFGAAGLVFLISFLDDVRGTPAFARLLVQVGASLLLILGGLRISIFPPSPLGDAAEYVVTVIWLVGLANAVNFLDGMNGLVPGLSAITCATFTVLALRTGQRTLAYSAVAMMAAQTAFLGFNIKPARVFLGDCGSVTTGFFMAGLGIMGDWSPRAVWVSGLVPILVLAVPIYDMVFITVNRVLTGRVRNLREWIEYTGRDHLHHRLNQLGLNRAQTVLAIWFLSAVASLGGVVVIEAGGRVSVGLIVGVQTVCVFLIVALLEFLALHGQARSKDGAGHKV